jgi:hypothetical protein
MAQPAAARGGTDRFADGQTQLLQLVKIRPGIIDRALLSPVGGRTRKFQRDFNHVRVLSPTVGRLGWVGGWRRAGQSPGPPGQPLATDAGQRSQQPAGDHPRLPVAVTPDLGDEWCDLLPGEVGEAQPAPVAGGVTGIGGVR